MGSSELLVRREAGVVIATLNRPDKMNALNKEVFSALKNLIDLIEHDSTARVLIITGAGDKAFCVGADLKERQGMNEKDILVRMDFVKGIYLKLERLKIPTIAAINGTALGGGLELALACDLRVAPSGAVFGLPEVDLAIMPGNGGTQRLSRLIGLAKALELILLAKKFSSEDALALNLVNAVVPANQVMSKALSFANKLLESGPIGIKQAKLAIRGGFERSYEHALDFEVECYKSVLYSKDRLEGIKAFIEKRKPVYRGE
ncbi:MAG: enoyl-CoA hydratase [Proteobacteria bacterium]|nr:enoyl-CoA hydratase [Pseudomonadota bacterium]NBY19200.1 enoyl-CoA hydratase [bacterium]